MAENLLMGLLNEVGSLMSKEAPSKPAEPKLTPSELRKAFPRLYKEFIYSDEDDVIQFLKDTNNLDRVMEFLSDAEMKAMESDDGD